MWSSLSGVSRNSRTATPSRAEMLICWWSWTSQPDCRSWRSMFRRACSSDNAIGSPPVCMAGSRLHCPRSGRRPCEAKFTPLGVWAQDAGGLSRRKAATRGGRCHRRAEERHPEADDSAGREQRAGRSPTGCEAAGDQAETLKGSETARGACSDSGLHAGFTRLGDLAGRQAGFGAPAPGLRQSKVE
jgi:hypothetical protein